MLREDANNRAWDRAGGVEKIGREFLYRFAMRQKLSLSNRVQRAFCSYEFVHRGVGDLTIDRLVGIQHRKFERQPFTVVTNYLAPRQRHRLALQSLGFRL
jgi:hypothetical protein